MINNVDLIAPTFEGRLSASEYSLSIRHLPDGYSFSITDNNQKCQAIKYICCNERNAAKELKEEPLLQQKYKSIKYFQRGISGLMPTIEYLNKNNNAHALLPPLFNSNGDIIRHKQTDLIVNNINEKIACCFIKSEPAFNLKNYSLHHTSELLIKLALTSEQPSGIWVEHTEYTTSIVIKKSNKILLANSYSTDTSTDAIYYIIHCYENCKLSQYETPIFLIDTENNQDKSLKNLLSPYIENIKNLTPKLWDGIPQYLSNNTILNIFTLQTEIIK